ncbi:MAG: hypothetical protein DRH32_09135 [Deltaproteobacteria bacterium]|nr:MAG: hypothetical protein DRH32_09135 [Deltaproteobacteria bacterium]
MTILSDHVSICIYRRFYQGIVCGYGVETPLRYRLDAWKLFFYVTIIEFVRQPNFDFRLNMKQGQHVESIF